jgi:hypothetical protein
MLARQEVRAAQIVDLAHVSAAIDGEDDRVSFRRVFGTLVHHDEDALAGAAAHYRFSQSCDRILVEQSGDHSRVEVGANTDDDSVLEMHDPTIAVVEPHAVPGRREGMKLDHRLIILDEQMLHMELRALRMNLTLSDHVISELHLFRQKAREFKQKTPLRQFAEGARVKRNSGRLDTVRTFSRRRPELERRDNPKVRLPFPSNPPGP